MLTTVLKRVILLIVIGSALICIAQLVMLSQHYYDGAILRASDGTNPWQPDGALVSVVDGDATPLQDNDLLVAIEGHVLSAWVDRLFCGYGHCDHLQVPAIHNGTNLTYTIIRDGDLQQVVASLRPYPLWHIIKQSWGGLAVKFISYLLFLILWIKQPDEPAIQAMVLATSGFIVSTRWQFGITVYDILTVRSFWWYLVATQVFYILASISFFHFALVFPRPLPFISRHPRWRLWLYLVTYTVYGTALILYALTTSNKLLWLEHSNTISTWLDTFTSVGSIIAIVVNYRSLERQSERQQVRIILFAIIILMLFALALFALPQFLFDHKLISDNAFSMMGLIIPFTIIFAIQRNRLWNIEPMINRALVYLSLSAIIMSIYMVVVAVAGEWLRIQTSSVSGLTAAGVVAVTFQPLRGRLQKIVNHVMYGERDDPARVLSQLAIRLETTDTPNHILPSLVQTIAQLLKIPYVAIWVPVSEDHIEVIAEYGKPLDQREMFSLIYHNSTIGYLVVAPRGIHERFTQSERVLLTTIATLTATTVRAVQLSDELRQSRQHIVTAREEERRRIRRDLHDGLGPQLASQTLGLEAISQLMVTDPKKAQSLIKSLQGQADEAIQDIRRLVYGLRPPALDELGFVEALTQSISRYETDLLHFKFELSKMPGELPAAIETALFRIAQEAVNNVVRHAEATLCTIRLSATGHDILMEIEDDGKGLLDDNQPGIGWQTMHERAAELNGETMIAALPNGGTLIKTKLPLEVFYE